MTGWTGEMVEMLERLKQGGTLELDWLLVAMVLWNFAIVVRKYEKIGPVLPFRYR